MPAIILANNLIAKLIGLNTYEINYIGTNKKAKTTEVPLGINKAKNFNPCCLTLIIFIPIKFLFILLFFVRLINKIKN